MSFIERDPIIGLTKERFRAAGVEGILFDLDDTLIFTSEIFTNFIVEYIDRISEQIGVDRSQFASELDELNVSLHKQFGVNPTRWTGVVEKLALLYPDSAEQILGGLPILKLIYTTVPRSKPGVFAVLDTFSRAGLKMGLVTHANVDWTYWKLDQVGLWNYFDGVVIADENGSKTSENWRNGAEMLNLDSNHCLAVGDNISGDIQSANSLGMKTAWIPSPWAVYREGKLPEGTIKINELSDLLTASLR